MDKHYTTHLYISDSSNTCLNAVFEHTGTRHSCQTLLFPSLCTQSSVLTFCMNETAERRQLVCSPVLCDVLLLKEKEVHVYPPPAPVMSFKSEILSFKSEQKCFEV